MSVTMPRSAAKIDRIAGHPTSATNLPGTGSTESDAYLRIMLANARLHMADSLFYFVPPHWQDNLELMMISQNRIVLGAEIFWGAGGDELRRRQGDPTATVFAQTVIPMQLDDSLFAVPAGFVYKAKPETWTDLLSATADTTFTLVDPPNSPTKTKANRKPKTAPKKTVTSTPKSPAHRRKQG